MLNILNLLAISNDKKISGMHFQPLGPTQLAMRASQYVFQVSRIIPLLLLLLPLRGIGQHADKQVSSFNSKLSSDRIERMVQDHLGYLWIATDDGLNRYDGYNFTVYKNIPGDSTSLPDNDIRTLTVDSAGTIWIGFASGNIACYKHSSRAFERIKSAPVDLNEEMVTLIHFDHAGTMWVGVVKNGLFWFDTASGRFKKAGDLPFIHAGYKKNPTYYENYNSIYDLYEDKDGIFWLATHDGLYQYHRSTHSFTVLREKQIIPFEYRDDLFGKILPDQNGLWLCGWGGGLTFYDTQKGTWKNYKPDSGTPDTHNIILDMEWKGPGQIWVASMDKAFGYFDITKKEFVFSDLKQSRELLKDASGTLWIATEQEGLLQFDPSTSFSAHAVHSSRSDNGDLYYTNSFYHDTQRGVLYYGVSYGDGLHVVDEQSGKEKVYSFDLLPTSEPGLQISQIYKDEKDTLWILTTDYLYLFDEQRQRLTKFSQPFNQNDEGRIFSPKYSCMLRSGDGDLWIGTVDQGVYRYSFDEKKFSLYKSTDKNGPASNSVKGIEEDSMGRIWLTGKKSISIYDGRDNTFQHYSELKIGQAVHRLTMLTDITRSSNGDLWISSNNGIYQYDHLSDSISFKHWSASAGVPSGKITAIASDQKGAIWFLMNSGMWRLDPSLEKSALIAVAAERSASSSIYIDEDNVIYQGAFRSYGTFNPKTQIPNTTAPPLVITSFKINNQEFPTDFQQEIELDYLQNAITIEFAALDFRNTSKNNYSFKLENLDENWSPPNSEQRLANYLHLRPGHYVFKVKAAAQEGVWTLPVTIRFHIAPPFWATWYFRIFMLATFIGLIYLFLRWRADVNRKKAIAADTLRETEMSSLRAQMNPHFIFNSLNSINKFILMSDRETASFYLTKFSKLIRLILENSDRPRITLDQELMALKHYIDIELLRFDHNFSYDITVDPNINKMNVLLPPLIIQPYVENSIWHGFTQRDNKFGRLTITIGKEDPGILVIVVEDNGVGRGARKNTLETSSKKSKGLKITADRLDILRREGKEASVDIIDLKNDQGTAMGTKVVIRMSIIEEFKNSEYTFIK